ncbi:MAG: sensor histidine kinase [Saprospiraceae bacterium]|nr:sensor histidine kinase [Saprospiraceae bacterium]
MISRLHFKQFLIQLILLSYQPSFAQSNVDSLKQAIFTQSDDSTKVLAILNVGNYYEQSNLDSAEHYYRKALNLSIDNKALFLEAKTISWFTDVLNKKGNLKEALLLNLRSLDVGKQINHQRLMVAAYANVALSYQYLGDYTSTLKYQLESLPLIEEYGDSVFLSSALANIAGTYDHMRQFEKAEQFALKARKIAESIADPQGVASAYLNLSVIYSHSGRIKEAIHTIQSALTISKSNNLAHLEALASLNLAEQLIQISQDQSALHHLNNGLKISLNLGDYETLARIYLGKSKIDFNSQNFESAFRHIDSSIELGRKHKFRDLLKEALLHASDIAYVQRKFDLASRLRKEHISLRDSLMNDEIIKSTAQWEVKLDLSKKESEIQTLQTENTIQQLQLSKKRNTIFALILLFALIASSLILVLQNVREKKKISEQELKISKQEIVRLEQEKQIAAADAILRGQEEERSRLAKDLHDGLGGMLSGIKQNLNVMKGNQILSETSATALGQVIGDLDKSINELRHIARNMMPEALLRFGLIDALADYCDHLQQDGRLQIKFQSYGFENRLSQDMEVVIFRIVQELLNNVVKHSGANHALVQLIRDGERISVDVEDNGKGMDTNFSNHGMGIGWLNIQSRVDFLKGHLDLRSAPGEGCSVHIEFKEK